MLLALKYMTRYAYQILEYFGSNGERQASE